MRRFLIVVAFAFTFGIDLARATDPPKIDRTIKKEPKYKSKAPQYALLALGTDAKDLVWIVQDGDTLFVDRNGNGDLTEPAETIAADKPKGYTPQEGEFSFDIGDLTLGGRTHKGTQLATRRLSNYQTASITNRSDLKAALAKNPKGTTFIVSCDVEGTGLKGGGLGGRLSFLAGPFDLNGVLQFANNPKDAPVIHLGGPLEVNFYSNVPTLRVGGGTQLVLVVGTPGFGPGTFAMLAYKDTIPDGVKPNVEIAYPSAMPNATPRKEKCALGERCCTVNLYGMVHVPADSGTGTATVTLGLDSWKEGKVASTTHALTVSPARTRPKVEPIAENLVATLPHPDARATLHELTFSADSKRLFATGYPSGVVQMFDVDNRKELRRIESPAGFRGALHYASLTPDWKTLYVNVEKRVVKPIEKNGKKIYRIEYSGPIRVWDMNTGEEKPALKPPTGSAPVFAKLSPSGQLLVCVERPSYDNDETERKDVTVIWDLKTGTRRKIADGFQIPAFAPNGKTLAIQSSDYETKTSRLQLLDTTTFQELASLNCSEKERNFSLDTFSPDGSVIAVSLGGKKGAQREVWFRDAKTLEDRGRFVGEGDPDRYGWGGGRFTPDGKHYVILGVKDKAVVWDIAQKKVSRTFALGNSSWNLAISSDSRMLAVPWRPKSEADDERASEPDPNDFPQPRVTVFDLAGNAPARTFIVPHCFDGDVAFSPNGKLLAFGTSGGVRLFDLTK